MPGSKLTFNVGVPELMEITSGTCEVKIAGEDAFKTYAAGGSFSIAENGSFDIHVGAEALNYVCSYG
jgi:uncharacterized protein YaiE (UPF0345 family)